MFQIALGDGLLMIAADALITVRNNLRQRLDRFPLRKPSPLRRSEVLALRDAIQVARHQLTIRRFFGITTHPLNERQMPKFQMENKDASKPIGFELAIVSLMLAKIELSAFTGDDLFTGKVARTLVILEPVITTMTAHCDTLPTAPPWFMPKVRNHVRTGQHRKPYSIERYTARKGVASYVH